MERKFLYGRQGMGPAPFRLGRPIWQSDGTDAELLMNDRRATSWENGGGACPSWLLWPAINVTLFARLLTGRDTEPAGPHGLRCTTHNTRESDRGYR